MLRRVIIPLTVLLCSMTACGESIQDASALSAETLTRFPDADNVESLIPDVVASSDSAEPGIGDDSRMRTHDIPALDLGPSDGQDDDFLEELGEDEVSDSLNSLLRCVAEEAPLDVVMILEASGSAWVDGPAGVGWLVVSDSGNDGDAVLLSQSDWQTIPMQLPLDGDAGDDTEGMSVTVDGRLVVLTSAGYFREWQMDESGFLLTRKAYPATLEPDWMCTPYDKNCGANFEGFCLHPAPADDAACLGYAVSKAFGSLVCVVETEDGFALDSNHVVAVNDPEHLSGCDYEKAPPHRLVVAGNLYSFSSLWQVNHPEAPDKTTIVELSIVGPANQEAIAFGPMGRLLSLGDTQGTTGLESPLKLFSCH